MYLELYKISFDHPQCYRDLEYKCLGWSLSLVMEMEGEESLCDILILILDLDSGFNAFLVLVMKFCSICIVLICCFCWLRDRVYNLEMKNLSNINLTEHINSRKLAQIVRWEICS